MLRSGHINDIVAVNEHSWRYCYRCVQIAEQNVLPVLDLDIMLLLLPHDATARRSVGLCYMAILNCPFVSHIQGGPKTDHFFKNVRLLYMMT